MNQLGTVVQRKRFHHLQVAVFRPQRTPSCVTYDRFVAKLVNHVQQRALEIGPAARIGTVSYAMNLLVAHRCTRRCNPGSAAPTHIPIDTASPFAASKSRADVREGSSH